MNNQNPVYTLINECHDCYRCVRECPVKAIKIENNHASVIPEKCISCGNCVKVCPANAKCVRADLEKVKNLLIAQKDVYVSLAPSWRSVFENSAKKMIAILKKLGFKEVSETAIGAQEVSIKTAEMLNNMEHGLWISSACPVIVDYIRQYKPEYAKYITPIGSPAKTHAKMLKETYGKDIAVVFIGPCIGKKNEADEDDGLIDVSLTFEELKIWIADEIDDLTKIKKENDFEFVPYSAHEGTLYPINGGMNQTIKKIGVKPNVQLMEICTISAFDRALENLDADKLEMPVFVEALACESGCITGPCIASQKASISSISDVMYKVKTRESIPTKAQTVVECDYSSKEVRTSKYTIEEIQKTLKKIGKHTEEDELNCGGCGYSSCRELAVALLDGVAESSMCISYMRKIAMRKAAAMLRCMPAAIVMVDNNMNIIEANDSFMKMFTGEMYEIFKARPDGMTGAAIDRIVEFSDLFRTILKTGKDLHKEHYNVNNRLYDINAFTIEPNEIVGAIITDVTQTETNREKISEKAKEVISKNISIVQEIACLLGEHMVETETLLNSIANDYDDKNEGDK
ncbi:MAG: 4Fe-4S dicluster domain-containing protein [Cyanobacteria bacterium SIG26]|nr:4Fe-4S dicluster domain-containing protein [Cyanobacteria bacterium SIG26]